MKAKQGDVIRCPLCKASHTLVMGDPRKVPNGLVETLVFPCGDIYYQGAVNGTLARGIHKFEPDMHTYPERIPDEPREGKR